MFRPAKVAVLAALFASAPALAQSVTLEDTRAGGGRTSADAADPVTPEQLALRLADLYDRTADLLRAEARGDEREYVDILETLVIDARYLSQAPGVVGLARFREAYSVVMTEYEQYYNAPSLDRGDIYAFREGLFQATEAVDGPLLEDVSLPTDLGPNVAVIPMPMNRLVESAVNYLRRATGHTNRVRSRADTYFPMIERILAEEGVPDELKYLAVVESALNPRARSHAAAAGMWQFIQATGAAYQLRVTTDRDDRLDPEQSTRAAARHLRDLHERFNGDWHLALAGYNCNPLRVERAIRDAEARLGRRATFWDIYDDIPRETRNYVPMFIATALIMSNPSSFGLRDHEPGPRYVYDEVPIEPGTSLSAVAMAAGTTVDAIRALNPSFRRDRVPDPASGSVRMVRVPVGAYAANERDLDRLAPASADRNPAYAARSVRYGSRNDFPLSVSNGEMPRYASASPTRSTQRAEDRPVRRLLGREEPAPPVVAVAERTTEPAETETTVADVPTETREEEPRAEERRPERRERARPTTHRVQRGEFLSVIARRYGVSVRQLREWNELSGDHIRPGQRLRVSADAPGARAAAARSRGPQVTTHRVASGQTLTSIARRYGVTISQIRSWNNLRSDVIRPGQRLRIETRRAVG
jgi:membrane-bound lytic murein transglycosylase D